ncbi:hypothetical protein D915_000848 [Fasciola hepatica]|uniref:Uncharacterized protein n=1 Tax=Fasciola hepatica TaxID=6192 RepID=A0A4E0RLF5_FASHE|nr:hypothetical protein D915_000848 [Fasciola hepatica]
MCLSNKILSRFFSFASRSHLCLVLSFGCISTSIITTIVITFVHLTVCTVLSSTPPPICFVCGLHIFRVEYTAPFEILWFSLKSACSAGQLANFSPIQFDRLLICSSVPLSLHVFGPVGLYPINAATHPPVHPFVFPVVCQLWIFFDA